MNSGIYIIANLENGKVYIGSTVREFRERWRRHRADLCAGHHVNPHLQRAWDRYGEDAFEFRVCEYIEDARDEPDYLIEREQYWLDWYHLRAEMYNVARTAGKQTMLGRSVSEKVRAKISATLMGHPVSERARIKMSSAQSARWADPEERAAQSARRQGYRATEDARYNLSVSLKGNENSSKPYPAFIHRETGEIIPAGVNLGAMCRRWGLNAGAMCQVKLGRNPHHKGWMLA